MYGIMYHISTPTDHPSPPEHHLINEDYLGTGLEQRGYRAQKKMLWVLYPLFYRRVVSHVVYNLYHTYDPQGFVILEMRAHNETMKPSTRAVLAYYELVCIWRRIRREIVAGHKPLSPPSEAGALSCAPLEAVGLLPSSGPAAEQHVSRNLMSTAAQKSRGHQKVSTLQRGIPTRLRSIPAVWQFIGRKSLVSPPPRTSRLPTGQQCWKREVRHPCAQPKCVFRSSAIRLPPYLWSLISHTLTITHTQLDPPSGGVEVLQRPCKLLFR